MDLLKPLRIAKTFACSTERRRYLRARAWGRSLSGSQEALLDCVLDGGLKMRVSPRDQFVSKVIYLTGTFEPDQLAYIRRHVRRGMTVVDAGANIGVHTLVMAAAVAPGGTVHSFEPTAAFERLCDNVRRNSFDPIVRLNRSALGGQNGEISLVECSSGNEALTSRGTPMIAGCASGRSIQVQVRTLDDYAIENAIDHVDLLKLDVEGSETDIIRGASGLLGRGAISTIMTEVNSICLPRCGSSVQELLGLLKFYGYRLFLLESGGELVPCPADKKDGWEIVVANR